MSDVKYNNNYKYVWNTQDSELRSLADENLSIYDYGKGLFILDYLMNIHFDFYNNSAFSLEYYSNVKNKAIVACTLFDSYIDMYNKDHIEIVNNAKEIFNRLEMYEIDTSGFYLDTGLVKLKEKSIKVRMVCIKQSYLNKILQEAKDNDIEKAINLYNMYKYLCNELIEKINGEALIGNLSAHPNYLCIRKRKITGYAKQIKDFLKYYGLEYFLKTDDDVFNVYKIKDVNTTVTMMKLINN